MGRDFIRNWKLEIARPPKTLSFGEVGRGNWKFSRQRGITLLLTILILASIVAVAITMTTIFLLQFRLSGGARDSVQAIYAADSGIEWRLFVERRCAQDVSCPTTPVLKNGEATFTWKFQDTTLKVVGSYRNTNRALDVRNFR